MCCFWRLLLLLLLLLLVEFRAAPFWAAPADFFSFGLLGALWKCAFCFSCYLSNFCWVLISSLEGSLFDCCRLLLKSLILMSPLLLLWCCYLSLPAGTAKCRPEILCFNVVAFLRRLRTCREEAAMLATATAFYIGLVVLMLLYLWKFAALRGS
jgi:hypothetical protein